MFVYVFVFVHVLFANELQCDPVFQLQELLHIGEALEGALQRKFVAHMERNRSDRDLLCDRPRCRNDLQKSLDLCAAERTRDEFAARDVNLLTTDGLELQHHTIGQGQKLLCVGEARKGTLENELVTEMKCDLNQAPDGDLMRDLPVAPEDLDKSLNISGAELRREEADRAGR